MLGMGHSLFLTFLRSLGGSFRALMISDEALGTTDTLACLFWIVNWTVIRSPFQSCVALAMSSPTFLGDWNVYNEHDYKWASASVKFCTFCLFLQWILRMPSLSSWCNADEYKPTAEGNVRFTNFYKRKWKNYWPGCVSSSKNLAKLGIIEK